VGPPPVLLLLLLLSTGLTGASPPEELLLLLLDDDGWPGLTGDTTVVVSRGSDWDPNRRACCTPPERGSCCCRRSKRCGTSVETVKVLRMPATRAPRVQAQWRSLNEERISGRRALSSGIHVAAERRTDTGRAIGRHAESLIIVAQVAGTRDARTSRWRG
jgi:hypothetical protein